MPGYIMHVTFAKLVAEKLGIESSNRYLAGSLIPDACTQSQDKDKTIGHFAKRLNGLFKDPKLNIFLEKYGDLLADDIVLGIYSHLYLDKYFYSEFMYEIFEFYDKTMVNKKNGDKFSIWDEFFSKNGVYQEYSAMNKMFINDYDLDIDSLNFDIKELPDITEFDYSKLKTFKERVIMFMKEKGRYTGKYIEYEQLKLFLEELAARFANHIKDLKDKK